MRTNHRSVHALQDKFNKRLPLHYATFYYAREALQPGATYARAESIEALVHQYPDGSRVQDSQGHIALTYALEKHAPPESLQVLERVTYPDQVLIAGKYMTWRQLSVVRACVRACVCACVRVCVRACVCARVS